MKVEMDRKLLDLIIEVRFDKLMQEIDMHVPQRYLDVYKELYAYGFRECLVWLQRRSLDVKITKEEGE